MAEAAGILLREGFVLGGIIQSNPHLPGRRRCDMQVTDLLTGQSVAISQDRGNAAHGCRLDEDAFAHVGTWIEQALSIGVALLVINKFGRQEALGKGLRQVIAAALLTGVPVVLGVSRRNLPVLYDFVGGPIDVLEPNPALIADWGRARANARWVSIGGVV